MKNIFNHQTNTHIKMKTIVKKRKSPSLHFLRWENLSLKIFSPIYLHQNDFFS